VERGGHRLELAPTLADQLERWVAIEIVWTAGLADAALHALGRIDG
jgi:hypothetical protein